MKTCRDDEFTISALFISSKTKQKQQQTRIKLLKALRYAAKTRHKVRHNLIGEECFTMKNLQCKPNRLIRKACKTLYADNKKKQSEMTVPVWVVNKIIEKVKRLNLSKNTLKKVSELKDKQYAKYSSRQLDFYLLRIVYLVQKKRPSFQNVKLIVFEDLLVLFGDEIVAVTKFSNILYSLYIWVSLKNKNYEIYEIFLSMLLWEKKEAFVAIALFARNFPRIDIPLLSRLKQDFRKLPLNWSWNIKIPDFSNAMLRTLYNHDDVRTQDWTIGVLLKKYYSYCVSNVENMDHFCQDEEFTEGEYDCKQLPHLVTSPTNSSISALPSMSISQAPCPEIQSRWTEQENTQCSAKYSFPQLHEKQDFSKKSNLTFNNITMNIDVSKTKQKRNFESTLISFNIEESKSSFPLSHDEHKPLDCPIDSESLKSINIDRRLQPERTKKNVAINVKVALLRQWSLVFQAVEHEAIQEQAPTKHEVSPLFSYKFRSTSQAKNINSLQGVQNIIHDVNSLFHDSERKIDSRSHIAREVATIEDMFSKTLILNSHKLLSTNPMKKLNERYNIPTCLSINIKKKSKEKCFPENVNNICLSMSTVGLPISVSHMSSILKSVKKTKTRNFNHKSPKQTILSNRQHPNDSLAISWRNRLFSQKKKCRKKKGFRLASVYYRSSEKLKEDRKLALKRTLCN